MQWRKYASKLPAMLGAVSGTAPQPCSAHIPVCQHLTRVTHAGSPTCLTINVANDSLWNSLKLLSANTFGLRIYESLVLLPSSANRVGAHIRIGYCTPCINLPPAQKIRETDSKLKQSKKQLFRNIQGHVHGIYSNTSSLSCGRLQFYIL